MGNYSGNTNLLTKKISKKSPRKDLIDIIDSLDSDYEEFQEEIVDDIIKKRRSVKKMVEDVLNGNFKELLIEEDGEMYDACISTWFLSNDTYCSGWEYELTDCGEHLFLSLSYGN